MSTTNNDSNVQNDEKSQEQSNQETKEQTEDEKKMKLLETDLNNCKSNTELLETKLKMYKKIYQNTVVSKYNMSTYVGITMIAIVGLIMLLYVILSMIPMHLLSNTAYVLISILLMIIIGTTAGGVWLGLLQNLRKNDVEISKDEAKTLMQYYKDKDEE